MKKTWKKSVIYAEKNCIGPRDLDKFEVLKGKADGANIGIKNLVKDESIQIGYRLWWLMSKSLTPAEFDSMKTYFKTRFTAIYGYAVKENIALNHFKGIRSPLKKQAEMDKLMNHLNL